MTERPILFSAPMVRALLDGSKTQTRRIMKPQPHEDWSPAHYGELHGYDRDGELTPDKVIGWGPVNDDGECGYRSPYGQPGDRLWVREAFAYRDGLGRQAQDQRTIMYAAAQDWQYTDTRWKPSIHMPRWASRITLEIVSVRAERLQDISEADAWAEGVQCASHIDYRSVKTDDGKELHSHAVDLYRELWESINGPGSWAANPWVWVVQFRKIAT